MQLQDLSPDEIKRGIFLALENARELSEDAEILLRRGICYDQLDKPHETLNDLKRSMELGNEKAKELYEQVNKGIKEGKSH